ncbi:MTP-1 family protein [Niallia alba]|uniref:MTP-1 family protein n=1 Tax=Niallia alba TaxID=2729105 RepID=UPI00399C7C55
MRMKTKGNSQTCEQLLAEFNNNNAQKPFNPEKIIFSKVGNHDVYNISAPFEDENELVIAGRVEARESEHSKVYFFVEQDGEWVPRETAPVLDLQDPFFSRIGGELIVGGVQIFPHPTLVGQLSWRTVFYKGKTLSKLQKFAKGPEGMKDLRLIELKDGTVGILTRPQGQKGGKGKIGWITISSLDELSVDIINNAPLLENQFIDEEWGGANEPHLLTNGLVGILGHIASFDDKGNRHYYPMVFALNPETSAFSKMKLIATRNQFLPGPSKRPDLVDVVFSGGLIRKSDGSADLYAGISDAEAQKITIMDPFLSYEQ